MATHVRDIEGDRSLVIDGNNKNLPGSVFLKCRRGGWMEFDRDTLIAGLKRELGLEEALMVGLERFLELQAA